MSLSWTDAARLRRRYRRPPPRRGDTPDTPGLHWVVAGLLLATGAETAVSQRIEAGRRAAAPLRVLRWAPLLLAPLAGAAQVASALRPLPENRRAARVANGLAIAVAAAAAAAGLAESIRPAPTPLGWEGRIARRRGRRAWHRLLAPLAFGAAGALGLLIDRHEREEAERIARLERRARVVERLVPRRRARLDRVVIHV